MGQPNGLLAHAPAGNIPPRFPPRVEWRATDATSEGASQRMV